MTDVYVVEGGLGRHVFFTALIPELAKDKKIMVMSSYTDVFENNPYVYRSLNRGTPYVWEDVVTDEKYNIKYSDPYFDDAFIKRKSHVIESWARQLGIEYTKNMKPELYFHKALKDDVKKFKQDIGPFIIVQFSSGQSPFNMNPNQQFKWTGFQRNYPIEEATWLIKMIKEEYPGITIINYSLPNEGYGIEGTTFYNLPSLFYAALLEEAETFIGINSSLTHYGGALNKKGIVLWGGTSHRQWGYEIHTNLYGECSYNTLCCSRPYLRDLGDFNAAGNRWNCQEPTCMNIEAVEVFDSFNSILTVEQKNRMKTHVKKEEVKQVCSCANDRETRIN